jgi:hypothetical protein
MEVKEKMKSTVSRENRRKKLPGLSNRHHGGQDASVQMDPLAGDQPKRGMACFQVTERCWPL